MPWVSQLTSTSCLSQDSWLSLRPEFPLHRAAFPVSPSKSELLHCEMKREARVRIQSGLGFYLYLNLSVFWWLCSLIWYRLCHSLARSIALSGLQPVPGPHGHLPFPPLDWLVSTVPVTLDNLWFKEKLARIAVRALPSTPPH